MTLLPSLGLFVVLLYGGHQALNGGISVGEFASFYTYVLMLVDPAGRIACWLVTIQEAQAAQQRLQDIMSHPVEGDASSVARMPGGSGRSPCATPASATKARARSSTGSTSTSRRGRPWPSWARRAAARAACCCCQPAVRPRFRVVEVDGQPAEQFELESLRRGMSAAVDSDFLFSWSVRDNIAYGRPDAADEQVREAARRTRTSSSRSSRRATTPPSALGASACPAESDSGSPSRAL